jgi:hypothetical protein
VLNIYEIDSGRGIYWEVWQDTPGEAWQDEYIITIETGTQLNEYINDLDENGEDYILHTLEEDDAVV